MTRRAAISAVHLPDSTRLTPDAFAMWKINARLGVLAAIFVGIPLRLLAQQETGAVEVVVNDQQGPDRSGSASRKLRSEIKSR